MASLLLTPFALQAQSGYPGSGGSSGADHCWQVTYASSGSATYHYTFSQSGTGPIYSGGGPWTDTTGETSSGGSSGGQYATDALSSGTVTATLTWVPASGQTAQDDPPPNVVIVAETAVASWSGGTYPGAGSASDGLGDAEDQYGVSSGTYYSVKDGSSGTITLTDTLNAQSAPYAPVAPNYGPTYASATASYSVTPYPVTVELTGGIGPSYAKRLLVGQQLERVRHFFRAVKYFCC
ncbi:MAG: hypothetical protein M3Y13_11070 [Armatimonadota bacterium]|nr:hypothetical protein [Armatimonadota bacterium]